ncbi:hypothetical protein AC249_AIPGENE27152 [Exaiptasia diaphana]|nr:hypothetical protein AC249_AIPGENE27152 [Exaiptasia diaphana]
MDTSSKTPEKVARIVLPFKEQKTADMVKRRLKDLGNKINIALQPVFTSRKLGDELKYCEKKPTLVNRQRVVYEFKCGFCDESYVGYTLRHLHERCDEHRNDSSSIKKHFIRKHQSLPEDINVFFKILRKCQTKFDCLVFEMLYIKEKRPSINVQSDSIKAKYLKRNDDLHLFRRIEQCSKKKIKCDGSIEFLRLCQNFGLTPTFAMVDVDKEKKWKHSSDAFAKSVISEELQLKIKKSVSLRDELNHLYSEIRNNHSTFIYAWILRTMTLNSKAYYTEIMKTQTKKIARLLNREMDVDEHIDNRSKWPNISSVLSPHFSSEKQVVILTGRACKDRLARLIEKHTDEDKKALKRSETEEDYNELKQLLEDIHTFRRDTEECERKEKERKNQKEKTDKKIGEQMRDAAIIAMSSNDIMLCYINTLY